MTNLLSIVDVFRRSRSPRGPRAGSLVLVTLCLFLVLLPPRDSAAAGPLDRLECMPGYTATIYARRFRSPDGLAFAPDGTLYVVEEGARRVSRIDGEGQVTLVLGDLRSPEGIAFDRAGNMYVVEDASSGRLIRLSPDGQITTLAENLNASEGVAVGPPGAGGAAPTVYVTESNVQLVRIPYGLESGITAIAPDGERAAVVSHTPRLHGLSVAFWSYAGLATGPDGRLYVTNELSGRKLERDVSILSGRLTYQVKILTGDSIFAIDPADGSRTLIAEDLLAPEGLSFSADGGYPLYVAEENVGRKGRLSRIEQDGRRTTVCERFFGIEDVAVDADGDLYVSEDGSGLVIRITVPETVDVSASAPFTAPQVDLLPHGDRIWRAIDRVAALGRRIARRLSH